MSKKLVGTLTATTPDQTQYIANIYKKDCSCAPGLKCVPLSKDLGFIRNLRPDDAADLIRQRGWTPKVEYNDG